MIYSRYNVIIYKRSEIRNYTRGCEVSAWLWEEASTVKSHTLPSSTARVLSPPSPVSEYKYTLNSLAECFIRNGEKISYSLSVTKPGTGIHLIKISFQSLQTFREHFQSLASYLTGIHSIIL